MIERNKRIYPPWVLALLLLLFFGTGIIDRAAAAPANCVSKTFSTETFLTLNPSERGYTYSSTGCTYTNSLTVTSSNSARTIESVTLNFIRLRSTLFTFSNELIFGQGTVVTVRDFSVTAYSTNYVDDITVAAVFLDGSFLTIRDSTLAKTDYTTSIAISSIQINGGSIAVLNTTFDFFYFGFDEAQVNRLDLTVKDCKGQRLVFQAWRGLVSDSHILIENATMAPANSLSSSNNVRLTMFNFAMERSVLIVNRSSFRTNSEYNAATLGDGWMSLTDTSIYIDNSIFVGMNPLYMCSGPALEEGSLLVIRRSTFNSTSPSSSSASSGDGICISSRGMVNFESSNRIYRGAVYVSRNGWVFTQGWFFHVFNSQMTKFTFEGQLSEGVVQIRNSTLIGGISFGASAMENAIVLLDKVSALSVTYYAFSSVARNCSWRILNSAFSGSTALYIAPQWHSSLLEIVNCTVNFAYDSGFAVTVGGQVTSTLNGQNPLLTAKTIHRIFGNRFYHTVQTGSSPTHLYYAPAVGANLEVNISGNYFALARPAARLVQLQVGDGKLFYDASNFCDTVGEFALSMQGKGEVTAEIFNYQRLTAITVSKSLSTFTTAQFNLRVTNSVLSGSAVNTLSNLQNVNIIYSNVVIGGSLSFNWGLCGGGSASATTTPSSCAVRLDGVSVGNSLSANVGLAGASATFVVSDALVSSTAYMSVSVEENALFTFRDNIVLGSLEIGGTICYGAISAFENNLLGNGISSLGETPTAEDDAESAPPPPDPPIRILDLSMFSNGTLLICNNTLAATVVIDDDTVEYYYDPSSDAAWPEYSFSEAASAIFSDESSSDLLLQQKQKLFGSSSMEDDVTVGQTTSSQHSLHTNRAVVNAASLRHLFASPAITTGLSWSSSSIGDDTLVMVNGNSISVKSIDLRKNKKRSSPSSISSVSASLYDEVIRSAAVDILPSAIISSGAEIIFSNNVLSVSSPTDFTFRSNNAADAMSSNDASSSSSASVMLDLSENYQWLGHVAIYRERSVAMTDSGISSSSSGDDASSLGGFHFSLSGGGHSSSTINNSNDNNNQTVADLQNNNNNLTITSSPNATTEDSRAPLSTSSFSSSPSALTIVIATRLMNGAISEDSEDGAAQTNRRLMQSAAESNASSPSSFANAIVLRDLNLSSITILVGNVIDATNPPPPPSPQASSSSQKQQRASATAAATATLVHLESSTVGAVAMLVKDAVGASVVVSNNTLASAYVGGTIGANSNVSVVGNRFNFGANLEAAHLSDVVISDEEEDSVIRRAGLVMNLTTLMSSSSSAAGDFVLPSCNSSVVDDGFKSKCNIAVEYNTIDMLDSIPFASLDDNTTNASNTASNTASAVSHSMSLYGVHVHSLPPTFASSSTSASLVVNGTALSISSNNVRAIAALSGVSVTPIVITARAVGGTFVNGTHSSSNVLLAIRHNNVTFYSLSSSSSNDAVPRPSQQVVGIKIAGPAIPNTSSSSSGLSHSPLHFDGIVSVDGNSLFYQRRSSYYYSGNSGGGGGHEGVARDALVEVGFDVLLAKKSVRRVEVTNNKAGFFRFATADDGDAFPSAVHSPMKTRVDRCNFIGRFTTPSDSSSFASLESDNKEFPLLIRIINGDFTYVPCYSHTASCEATETITATLSANATTVTQTVAASPSHSLGENTTTITESLEAPKTRTHTASAPITNSSSSSISTSVSAGDISATLTIELTASKEETLTGKMTPTSTHNPTASREISHTLSDGNVSVSMSDANVTHSLSRNRNGEDGKSSRSRSVDGLTVTETRRQTITTDATRSSSLAATVSLNFKALNKTGTAVSTASASITPSTEITNTLEGVRTPTGAKTPTAEPPRSQTASATLDVPTRTYKMNEGLTPTATMTRVVPPTTTNVAGSGDGDGTTTRAQPPTDEHGSTIETNATATAKPSSTTGGGTDDGNSTTHPRTTVFGETQPTTSSPPDEEDDELNPISRTIVPTATKEVPIHDPDRSDSVSGVLAAVGALWSLVVVGGTSAEFHSLVVLLDGHCTDQRDHDRVEYVKYILTPFWALGRRWAVLGNVLLIATVGLCQSLLVLYRCGGVSKMRKKTSPQLKAAMRGCYFPAVTLCLAMVLYIGICHNTVSILREYDATMLRSSSSSVDDDGEGQVVTNVIAVVFGLLFMVASPCAAFLCIRLVTVEDHVTHHLWSSSSSPSSQSALSMKASPHHHNDSSSPPQPAAASPPTSPQSRTAISISSAIRWLFVPSGYSKEAALYGPIVTYVRPERKYWALFPWALCLIVAVVLNLPAGGDGGGNSSSLSSSTTSTRCNILYIALMLIFVMCAVFVFAAGAHRSNFSRLVSAATLVALALFSSSFLFAEEGEGKDREITYQYFNYTIPAQPTTAATSTTATTLTFTSAAAATTTDGTTTTVIPQSTAAPTAPATSITNPPSSSEPETATEEEAVNQQQQQHAQSAADRSMRTRRRSFASSSALLSTIGHNNANALFSSEGLEDSDTADPYKLSTMAIICILSLLQLIYAVVLAIYEANSNAARKREKRMAIVSQGEVEEGVGSPSGVDVPNKKFVLLDTAEDSNNNNHHNQRNIIAGLIFNNKNPNHHHQNQNINNCGDYSTDYSNMDSDDSSNDDVFSPKENGGDKGKAQRRRRSSAADDTTNRNAKPPLPRRRSRKSIVAENPLDILSGDDGENNLNNGSIVVHHHRKSVTVDLSHGDIVGNAAAAVAMSRAADEGVFGGADNGDGAAVARTTGSSYFGPHVQEGGGCRRRSQSVVAIIATPSPTNKKNTKKRNTTNQRDGNRIATETTHNTVDDDHDDENNNDDKGGAMLRRRRNSQRAHAAWRADGNDDRSRSASLSNNTYSDDTSSSAHNVADDDDDYDNYRRTPTNDNNNKGDDDDDDDDDNGVEKLKFSPMRKEGQSDAEYRRYLDNDDDNGYNGYNGIDESMQRQQHFLRRTSSSIKKVPAVLAPLGNASSAHDIQGEEYHNHFADHHHQNHNHQRLQPQLDAHDSPNSRHYSPRPSSSSSPNFELRNRKHNPSQQQHQQHRDALLGGDSDEKRRRNFNNSNATPIVVCTTANDGGDDDGSASSQQRIIRQQQQQQRQLIMETPDKDCFSVETEQMRRRMRAKMMLSMAEEEGFGGEEELAPTFDGGSALLVGNYDHNNNASSPNRCDQILFNKHNMLDNGNNKNNLRSNSHRSVNSNLRHYSPHGRRDDDAGGHPPLPASAMLTCHRGDGNEPSPNIRTAAMMSLTPPHDDESSNAAAVAGMTTVAAAAVLVDYATNMTEYCDDLDVHFGGGGVASAAAGCGIVDTADGRFIRRSVRGDDGGASPIGRKTLKSKGFDEDRTEMSLQRNNNNNTRNGGDEDHDVFFPSTEKNNSDSAAAVAPNAATHLCSAEGGRRLDVLYSPPEKEKTKKKNNGAAAADNHNHHRSQTEEEAKPRRAVSNSTLPDDHPITAAGLAVKHPSGMFSNAFALSTFGREEVSEEEDDDDDDEYEEEEEEREETVLEPSLAPTDLLQQTSPSPAPVRPVAPPQSNTAVAGKKKRKKRPAADGQQQPVPLQSEAAMAMVMGSSHQNHQNASSAQNAAVFNRTTSLIRATMAPLADAATTADLPPQPSQSSAPPPLPTTPQRPSVFHGDDRRQIPSTPPSHAPAHHQQQPTPRRLSSSSALHYHHFNSSGGGGLRASLPLLAAEATTVPINSDEDNAPPLRRGEQQQATATVPMTMMTTTPTKRKHNSLLLLHNDIVNTQSASPAVTLPPRRGVVGVGVQQQQRRGGSATTDTAATPKKMMMVGVEEDAERRRPYTAQQHQQMTMTSPNTISTNANGSSSVALRQQRAAAKQQQQRQQLLEGGGVGGGEKSHSYPFAPRPPRSSINGGSSGVAPATDSASGPNPRQRRLSSASAVSMTSSLVEAEKKKNSDDQRQGRGDGPNSPSNTLAGDNYNTPEAVPLRLDAIDDDNDWTH